MTPLQRAKHLQFQIGYGGIASLEPDLRAPINVAEKARDFAEALRRG